MIRGASAPVLADLEILLVEDEAIIALMLEDVLGDLGCAGVLHASDVAEALALLERRRPGAAVLDINLAGRFVFPVAERLDRLGVPFVFATGYGREIIPEPWQSRPCIPKPVEPSLLALALRMALGRG
jgi:CheY-like chemotaxis protein